MPPPYRTATDRPVFVVGANRSGTTLMRLMLNAHPDVAIPEELNYFKHTAYDRPWYRPGWTRERYESYVEETLARCMPLLPGVEVDAVRNVLLEVNDPTYRTPYAHMLRAWAQSEDAARWGEKTPGNLFYVDLLIEMFPQAQFVYMARDPRAGVASMQRVDFFPDDVIFNALNRRKSWNVGYRLLSERVPASQWCTVRYEDLVTAPEHVAQRLCSFLNLPYDPEMLRFHQDAEQYMKPEAAASFNEIATRPISTAPLERWQTDLTDTEVAWVEAICADEMHAFDYASTHARCGLSARVLQWIKQAYWHYDVWRHRAYRPYIVRHAFLGSLRKRLHKRLRGWQSESSHAPKATRASTESHT